VAPHGYIHKYTRTSHEGMAHYEIDKVFCREERHPSILDVRHFRRADCDTDYYLVVAEVRERLAVYRRAVNKTDTEILNLKKLKEGLVKEQYQITIKISGPPQPISLRSILIPSCHLGNDTNRSELHQGEIKTRLDRGMLATVRLMVLQFPPAVWECRG
jgi:hypothetical protein